MYPSLGIPGLVQVYTYRALIGCNAEQITLECSIIIVVSKDMKQREENRYAK